MTEEETFAAAIAEIAGPRGTGRLADGRASVILDVSGMDTAARDDLEARLIQGLASFGQVRVAMTSERPNRRLIAVASGKGGVGKSTLAANLAVALARAGTRVGLVDADIYGPSQPRLMATDTKPTAHEKQLNPVMTPYGLPMLSMGQLVPADQAIAWRGPMAAGALGQMVDANWGSYDTLIVDLPPGTGDVQLTMIQKYRPVGAVIVSTPQDLALIDAKRAIDLFVKAGIPIIGLVENMAGYACPSCGAISDPFGSGGAEAAAAALGIAFLGRVPLDIGIREASDAGTPPAARDDDTIFASLAGGVRDWLNAH